MFYENYSCKDNFFFRILLTIVLLFTSIQSSFSQEKKRTDKFEKLLAGRNFGEAKTYLTEWSKAEPGSVAMLRAWARIYAAEKNYRLALLFIHQVFEKLENPDAESWLLLGEIQQKSNLFGEAAESFRKAWSLNKNRKELPLRIRQCEFGEKLKAAPAEVRISNAGKSLNSTADERRPFPSADFLHMFYLRNSSDGQSVMQANGNQSSWEQGSEVTAFAGSGKKFSFSGTSHDGNLMILEAPGGKGDLYFSTNLHGNWSDPIPFEWNSPKFRDYSASVSEDGNVLLFVSDRSGNPDIWFSRRKESKWLKPEKAGPAVNTKSEEDSPWLDAEGQYLYFSSRGHEGLGGYDVFRVPFGKQGLKPENIGYPLNSAADDLDFMLMPDEKTAFYATNREGGQGGFDVFSVRMGMAVNTKLILFKGTVADAYGAPLDATVTVTEIGQNKPFASLKSNALTGTFVTLLPAGKSYSVQVEKEAYLFYSDLLNFQESAGADSERKIRLQKLLAGTTLLLNNIFFDQGKSSLRRESSPELQKLLLILRQNPGIRAEISGHLEPGGPEDVLVKLSENRAQAVVDYLVATGIKSTRLLAKGYGSSKSAVSEKSEKEKIPGNRTEFRILSIQ